MRRLKNKPWFNYAAALCIAVVLYVVLTHIPGLRKGIRTFLGYFKPVILGCVIAYVINSLSNLYERSVFRWIKKEVPREAASIVLAFVTVLLLLTLLMLLLIPQLVDSIRLFVFNLDGYAEAVNSFLDRLGISASALGIDGALFVNMMNMIRFDGQINLRTILFTVAVIAGIAMVALEIIRKKGTSK